MALSTSFPVNSCWELTLSNDSKVEGRVYTTDETSQTVVLIQSLVHTTLAVKVHLVQASQIVRSKAVQDDGNVMEIPLGKISKKQLEEREKKAIKMAQERLSHINQDASPEGQSTFDRLWKACGEHVVWKGESIVVLGQVRVDPPYTAETCSVLLEGGKNRNASDSLDRVKKIVSHSSSSFNL
jgi:hypothetical protein